MFVVAVISILVKVSTNGLSLLFILFYGKMVTITKIAFTQKIRIRYSILFTVLRSVICGFFVLSVVMLISFTFWQDVIIIYRAVRNFFQLFVKKSLCFVRLLKLIDCSLLLKLKKITFRLMIIITIIVVILIIANQNSISSYNRIVVRFVNVISVIAINAGIYCVIFGNQNWI